MGPIRPSVAPPREATFPVSSPKVAIIVLNWNDTTSTLACVDALRLLDYPNHSTIVVDNGSVPPLCGSSAFELIRNPTNLGYAGGVNVGIGRAVARGADYVWLLNSDATVRPDVLSRLVVAAEADERIGLVSPVFFDADLPQNREFCLGRFDPAVRIATQTADPLTALDWQKNYPDQVIVLGTALLIRRRLIEMIGLLDQSFFAYVEDVDYSLRAHAAGFRTIALPEAVAFHKFKQPVQNPSSVPAYLHYFMTRNYLLLWRKLPRPRLMRKATFWFLHQRLKQIDGMRDAPAAVDAVLAGLWDGIRGVGGPYRPNRTAPWWLRATLGRHPDFWLSVLDAGRPFRWKHG